MLRDKLPHHELEICPRRDFAFVGPKGQQVQPEEVERTGYAAAITCSLDGCFGISCGRPPENDDALSTSCKMLAVGC